MAFKGDTLKKKAKVPNDYVGSNYSVHYRVSHSDLDFLKWF